MKRYNSSDIGYMDPEWENVPTHNTKIENEVEEGRPNPNGGLGSDNTGQPGPRIPNIQGGSERT